jgi:pimeloyl-ACP methyl ester carboxylesterase
VGHDWGAALSWDIATHNTERIIKLTVLSNGHIAGFFSKGGNEQRQRSWYMLLFNSPQGESVISANNFALWRSVCEYEQPEIVEDRIKELSKAGVDCFKTS